MRMGEGEADSQDLLAALLPVAEEQLLEQGHFRMIIMQEFSPSFSDFLPENLSVPWRTSSKVQARSSAQGLEDKCKLQYYES